jgi:hypothetical protein
MIVAIHQPNYIPWIGYFYKIAHSDTFVFLDNVQLSTGRGFGSRNKIKTSNGALWLTVPCKKKGRNLQFNCDVEIDNSTNWRKKHQETLYHNYSKASSYQVFKDLLDIYDKEWLKLIDLNAHFISQIMLKCRIDTAIVRSSLLNPEGSNEDLIIDICKKLNADMYLSGFGASEYQNEQKFNAVGLTLRYSNFTSPIYPQLFGDFEFNLSILDFLFNCGMKGVNTIIKRRDYDNR